MTFSYGSRNICDFFFFFLLLKEIPFPLQPPPLEPERALLSERRRGNLQYHMYVHLRSEEEEFLWGKEGLKQRPGVKNVIISGERDEK